MIDQAIVLFGKPTRISCRSWPQRGIEGLDEAVSLLSFHTIHTTSLALSGPTWARDPQCCMSRRRLGTKLTRTVHDGPRVPGPTRLPIPLDHHHQSIPFLTSIPCTPIPSPRYPGCICQTRSGPTRGIPQSWWESQDGGVYIRETRTVRYSLDSQRGWKGGSQARDVSRYTSGNRDLRVVKPGRLD